MKEHPRLLLLQKAGRVFFFCGAGPERVCVPDGKGLYRQCSNVIVNTCGPCACAKQVYNRNRTCHAVHGTGGGRHTMKKARAVLFDMDGLMFDTQRLWDKAWRQAGEACGVAMGEAQIAPLRGAQLADSRAIF